MRAPLLLLFACCLSAPINSQSRTVTFTGPSGLAAEAEVLAVNKGLTVVVRLRNLSTGVPAGFGAEDQLLSSVSMDFGAPGANPGDPRIVGGQVTTGRSSFTVNFSNANVGPNKGVTGEFGFAAGTVPGLYPDVVSSKAAGTTPFGGVNLHGPPDLGGPDAGLIPNPGAIVPLGGVGAIQDEVIMRLNVAPSVPDLTFLLNGMRIEFGDGAATVEGDCTTFPFVVPVPDPGGLNANGTLDAANMPVIGAGSFDLVVDDPLGTCNVTPGSMVTLFVSLGTASQLYPGLGCTAGAMGEIMLDFNLPSYRAGDQPWVGPGSPASFSTLMPNDPNLCGVTYFAQGLFTDPTGPAGPYILTNRLDVTLGY